MKDTTLLATTLALMTAGCASPMREAGVDLAAVDAVLERQQAAWNAGDVDAFMSEGYWNSEMLTFLSGGDWNWGYDAVLQRYRDRYQAEGKEMGTLEFSDEQIIPLGPDSAFVRGRYHLDFTDGETADGLFTLVLRRLDDGWRIVHDHTSAAETEE